MIVQVYNYNGDPTMDVNDSRKYLFTQKTRSLENRPLTQEVLKQHIKQARYQSICRKNTLTAMQELTDPANWGWKRIQKNYGQQFQNHPKDETCISRLKGAPISVFSSDNMYLQCYIQSKWCVHEHGYGSHEKNPHLDHTLHY